MTVCTDCPTGKRSVDHAGGSDSELNTCLHHLLKSIFLGLKVVGADDRVREFVTALESDTVLWLSPVPLFVTVTIGAAMVAPEESLTVP